MKALISNPVAAYNHDFATVLDGYQSLVHAVPMLGTVTTNDWYDPYQCLVR
ncbi:MAG: hypothetical protein SPI30_04840 [Prevotella sp.]|nr:hypothetical protein [Prevotella sp.]